MMRSECTRSGRYRHSRTPRRSGSLSIELLLVLPILSVLAAGVVQLSLTIAEIERLTHASHVGARVAAQGGNRHEVEEAVCKALGEQRCRHAEIEIATLDLCHSGDGHDDKDDHDDRRHGDNDGRHDDDKGKSGGDDGNDDHEGKHRCCAELVRVCVKVRASCVVPGPLIIFGCKDEWLTGCSVMRKE